MEILELFTALEGAVKDLKAKRADAEAVGWAARANVAHAKAEREQAIAAANEAYDAVEHAENEKSAAAAAAFDAAAARVKDLQKQLHEYTGGLMGDGGRVRQW